jgi:dihydroorotase
MILIKNAKLVDGNVTDILVDNETIIQIDKNIINPNTKTIDADGNYLLPGIVDLNIRLRDNQLNLKNIEELNDRALKAGITTAVLNCDFTPKVENETFFHLLIEELKNKELNIVASIKALNRDQKLNNISKLVNRGAKVISQESDISTSSLRCIAQYALMHNLPMFILCQNRDLNSQGVMNENALSNKLGLPGIFNIGEISEVAKQSTLSVYYKATTLFQSISTRDSLDIINYAKKSFNKLYSEVSIHHLLKSDVECTNFNTYAKINPPLRTDRQRELLIDALKHGLIDTLTTLFSPQSIINKDLPFELAKFGIDEIEEFLPLCYTYLVKSKIISMSRLIELISITPAKIIGFDNQIKVGNRANFILFNPNSEKIVNNKNSLYYGEQLYGEVVPFQTKTSSLTI